MHSQTTYKDNLCPYAVTEYYNYLLLLISYSDHSNLFLPFFELWYSKKYKCLFSLSYLPKLELFARMEGNKMLKMQKAFLPILEETSDIFKGKDLGRRRCILQINATTQVVFPVQVWLL